MRRHLRVLCAIMFLFINGCTFRNRMPEEAQPNTWSRAEMSSRRGSFLEADLKPGSPICGFGLATCSFELYYFKGPRWYDTSRVRHILYIPGGPGDVVDRENPPLDIFNIAANFVYFDVRGTGYSSIHESNAYDQFLRAKYVVEDIEALRKKYFNECSKGEKPVETKCEEKRKPWDAIYAHSWGTVVAQLYAREYPENVNALILSAPVSRINANTGAFRRKMIVENLLKIFDKYKTPECPWPKEDSALPGLGQPSPPWVDNFCFLKKGDLEHIKNALESLLERIERAYGSTVFVGRYYDQLIKETTFNQTYRYPPEFFRALRWLEMYGGAEDKGYSFLKEVKIKKLHAAFYLAYFLRFSPDDLPSPVDDKGERVVIKCALDAPLITAISDRLGIKGIYCLRINAAQRALDNEARTDGSLRASSVFGVFDGIARWIFRLMEEERRTGTDGCFKVQDLHDATRENLFGGRLLGGKTTVQEVIKRIGTTGLSKDKKICPWDPATKKQTVPTLILGGASDPVTAGGQAEYFYVNGLTPGKRAFVEFTGVGHEMSPQVETKSDGESEEILAGKLVASYQSIISRFITHANNVDDFLKDKAVKDRLNQLNARLRAD